MPPAAALRRWGAPRRRTCSPQEQAWAVAAPYRAEAAPMPRAARRAEPHRRCCVAAGAPDDQPPPPHVRMSPMLRPPFGAAAALDSSSAPTVAAAATARVTGAICKAARGGRSGAGRRNGGSQTARAAARARSAVPPHSGGCERPASPRHLRRDAGGPARRDAAAWLCRAAQTLRGGDASASQTQRSAVARCNVHARRMCPGSPAAARPPRSPRSMAAQQLSRSRPRLRRGI